MHLRRRSLLAVSLALAVAAPLLVGGVPASAATADPASSASALASSGAPGAFATPPPTASAGAGTVTAQATVYTFGTQPLVDVNYWAGQKADCGLTGPQLATIMLAPTYPETGASGTSAPSPMTLSRYDTQAGLYAFGNTATAYQNAFWHPGVGAFAFDSAGGWNLSTAQAIDTNTAAQQAATTMAARWCNASSISDPVQHRASVWSPWLGCDSGRCETFYQAMYSPAGPKVQVDASVTRDGGMVTRTCRVPGVGTVTCSFVDPSQAEGFKAWNVLSWGRSPVSAPFYAYTVGTTEYRVWLRSDTGYDSTITASKPITSNARSSLTWVKGDGLCDVTTGHGTCNWTGWTPYSGTWQGKPAVATNADGRLEMFAVASNGTVGDAWQLAANGDWSGWVTFPGLPGVGSLAAARGIDGYLVLTALTTSGTVWQATQKAVGWTAWTQIGSGVSGSMTIGHNQDGRLEVFVLDGGGALWHAWQLVGGGWSPFALLGGHSLTGISVASNQDGRVEVFAVGGDHAIYHVWQVARNSIYSGWQSLGGSVQGAPSTANDPDGRIEVVTRGTDNRVYDVWQTSPNGAWSPVLPLGTQAAGGVTGDPVVVRNRDGRLELFAPGSDGTPTDMWQVSVGGTWSGLVPFGGATTSALVGTNNADGHLVLFQVTGANVVQRNVQLV